MESIFTKTARRVRQRLLSKAKTKTKKAYRRRKYRLFKPRVLTLKGHTGVPDKLVCQLKYVNSHVLGNGVEIIPTYTYRCNSVFDPDYTGTGHQPLYYDQFSAIYNNYKVVKAHFKIRALSTQGAANSNIFFGALIITDPAIEINANTIRERPGCKYRTLTPQQGQTINIGWNIKKTVGSEDGLTSAINGNPTSVDFMRFFVCAADGIAGVPADIARINVEVIYTVEFFNPVSVIGS